MFDTIDLVNLLISDKEEEEDFFVQRQDTISYGSWLYIYIYTYWSHVYTDLGDTI